MFTRTCHQARPGILPNKDFSPGKDFSLGKGILPNKDNSERVLARTRPLNQLDTLLRMFCLASPCLSWLCRAPIKFAASRDCLEQKGEAFNGCDGLVN